MENFDRELESTKENQIVIFRTERSTIIKIKNS